MITNIQQDQTMDLTPNKELQISEKEKPSANSFKSVSLISLALALFWVIFIWGFLNKGVYALGLNTSVFFALAVFLLSKIQPENKLFQKKNWIWLLPLSLVILSFAIFDNPFIKSINLLVIPLFVIVFYNYSLLKDEAKRFWGISLVQVLIARTFSPLGFIGSALNIYSLPLRTKDKARRAVLKRVIMGLLLFFALSLFVVLPLLSSADQIFAGYFSNFYTWLNNLISTDLLQRFFVFVFLSIFFLALSLAWAKKFDFEKKSEEKEADSIVSGIVIGGILGIYLLFLFVQLKYLWLKTLPIDFQTTETIVKSGFWQLLFLSLVNITLFYSIFRKTNKLVQKILLGFTVASFLLLLSAGYRMFLYAMNYGLSYEKFYASYAVVYCAILFVWFLTRFVQRGKTDIIKFLLFLFLWMYGLVTVFPMEYFVVKTNIALSKRAETRLNLYELSMFSLDVLPLIEKEQKNDLVQNKNCVTGSVCEKIDWSDWIGQRREILGEKKWYEKTVFNYFE